MGYLQEEIWRAGGQWREDSHALLRIEFYLRKGGGGGGREEGVLIMDKLYGVTSN